MRLPEPVSALIARARRRLTLSRLIVATVVGGGVGAAFGSGLVAAARNWLWPWAEPVAAVVAGAMVTGFVIAALRRRPSLAAAALAVDQQLNGHDRVSTALELTARDRELTDSERWQVRSAGAWAEGRSRERVGRVAPPRKVVFLAGLAIAGTLTLALVPAESDRALAARQESSSLIKREAAALEQAAESFPPELAEEVERLVDELGVLFDVREALRLLEETRQELAAELDPAALARRTALTGLERSLERRPIGAGEDPAAQLRSLAAQLAAVDPDALTAAARELAARAGDFAGVDPEAASRLGEAATALRTLADLPDSSPVIEATREALARAAGAVEEAASRAADDRARSDLAAQIRSAQQRLAESASSPGDGQGQGQGQGQGRGAGGAGGQGAGGSSGAGTGSGGTGSGSVPDGSGDDDPFARPDRGQVFDPIPGGLGEEVRVRIEGNQSGEIEGTVTGHGVENLPLTPYSDRYEVYAREALDALERTSVPARLQDLVRDYFTRLEP